MTGYGLEQVQRSSQLQTQKISQRQIQALRILALGNQDLRDEIYRKADENPALEIAGDPTADGGLSGARTADAAAGRRQERTETAPAAGGGEAQSDQFQQLLESAPDGRETLQDHLMMQLNVMNIPDAERRLCAALISNLDSSGFHILAPETLPGAGDSERGRELLARCVGYVRRMDPVGVCCINAEESLAVQAELKGSPSALTRFLLRGHLDMLAPPVPEKIRRKLLSFFDRQEKLAFRRENSEISRDSLSLDEIAASLKYIQSLDPRPAHGFGAAPPTQYVRPDVYVSRETGPLDSDSPERGLVRDGDGAFFRITLAADTLPAVRISQEFQDALRPETERTAAAGARPQSESRIPAESPRAPNSAADDARAFAADALKDARAFLETLDYRGRTIVRTVSLLVGIQREFFRLGPGHLAPLSRRAFAKTAGVHESTVSRMADSKFIHCGWGLFPVKYFFSTAIPAAISAPAPAAGTPERTETAAVRESVSSDTVKREIVRILSERRPDGRRLSDSRLAAELAARGYQIARRTVAKYRAQLHIDSSYDRV